MPTRLGEEDQLKHRLRLLKKDEIRIRCGIEMNGTQDPARLIAENCRSGLVWHEFFDVRDEASNHVRYSMRQLMSMDESEIQGVVGEFFSHIFFRMYRETGILDVPSFDPTHLSKLGLSYDADARAIKSRFRELAKKYHPDTGGDSASFIELLSSYRKLLEK